YRRSERAISTGWQRGAAPLGKSGGAGRRHHVERDETPRQRNFVCRLALSLLLSRYSANPQFPCGTRPTRNTPAHSSTPSAPRKATTQLPLTLSARCSVSRRNRQPFAFVR